MREQEKVYYCSLLYSLCMYETFERDIQNPVSCHSVITSYTFTQQQTFCNFNLYDGVHRSHGTDASTVPVSDTEVQLLLHFRWLWQTTRSRSDSHQHLCSNNRNRLQTLTLFCFQSSRAFIVSVIQTLPMSKMQLVCSKTLW